VDCADPPSLLVGAPTASKLLDERGKDLCSLNGGGVSFAPLFELFFRGDDWTLFSFDFFLSQ